MDRDEPHSVRFQRGASAPLTQQVEALLPLVTQPGRYLGSEIHAIHRAWTPERVKWLLILPEVYEIGMSHQGLRILYDVLNRREDSLAERAFAPWTDMDDRMRAAGVPLFALESRRAARDFDVLGFSLQYELLATNVVNLLDLAGVPLLSRERGDGDPLVAGGGPCTANPEPLAELCDFFLIGDGEQAVGAISSVIAATRGRPRRERLRTLAEIPGVYVPCFYEPVYENGRQVAVEPRDGVPAPVLRTYVEDLATAPYPQRPIIPLIEAVQDRLTLEIQRGCTQGCRFCQAGIFYRPLRERAPRQLAQLVAQGLPVTGWDDVGLSSLSSADYSQIAPLASMLSEALRPSRTGLSLSSLRADTFSVELADLVSRVRKTGLTFAPEAGTERLRAVINKRVADEDLRAAVSAVYARGWQRVKLYFMVGLPTETAADLDGIVELVRELRAIGRQHGKSRSVTVAIGAFVPKAHTPFQWEAFEDRARLRAKLADLRHRVQSRWSQVKWHEVDLAFIEAILARGDRRVSRAIVRAWELGGRFDGWTEHFDIARWEQAFRDTGIDPLEFTAARDPALPLPWDHISLGVNRTWLLRERERAFASHPTADCRSGACTMCGLGGPQDRRLAGELSADQWAQLAGQIREAVGSRWAGPQGSSVASPAAVMPPLCEATRYRLSFSKMGPMRFISHLETGRLFTRLLRMARWPLAFTQGHNPRPKIAYGPPLPLGVEGAQELMDVFLCAPPTGDDLTRLNGHAPRGVSFLSITPVPTGESSLATAAAAALYTTAVPDDLHGRALRERRIESFAAATSVMMLKPSAGRQKMIDLKRCVRVLRWEPSAGALTDAEPGRLLTMELLLQDPGGHVAGPLRVLRELFQWSAEDMARCRVTRRRIVDDSGNRLPGSAVEA